MAKSNVRRTGAARPAAGPVRVTERYEVPPPIAEDDLEEVSDLDPMLTEDEKKIKALKGPGKAWVYLLANGERVLRGKLDRDQVIDDEEVIAQRYGGGEYEVDLRNPDGSYAFRYWRLAFSTATYGPQKTAEGSANANGDISAILREVAKENRLAVESQNNRFDSLMKTVVEVMGKQAAIPAQVVAPPQNSIGAPEIISMFQGAVKMTSDIAERASRVAAPIAAGEGGERMGFFEQAALRAIDVIAPLVTRAMSQPPRGGPGTATHVQATSGAGQGSAPPVTLTEAQQMVERIKGNFLYKSAVPELLARARRKSDPAEAAGEILDSIPGKFYGIVEEVINRPDYSEYLMVFEPEVGSHRDWFIDLANELRDILKQAKANIQREEEQDDEEDADGDGDTPPGFTEVINPPEEPPLDTSGGGAT